MVNVGCIDKDDIMNESATCGKEQPQHSNGATLHETPVTADPVGISIRKGKELEPSIPICQYCKNGIPRSRWCVINKVERKRGGYSVKHIHIFHAKLALSNDEFQLLLRLLKSSSDTEIKELRSAWIQTMNQGMGKGAKTGSTRRSSREWFTSENK